MSGRRAALWAEALKARRSKVPWLTALGFAVVPLVGGLFMVILKDPEGAREMGLIGTKARLTAGTADWPSYFTLLTQTVMGGGAILFALVTSWVFGREFSDRTVKDLLALPTPRTATVTAKFVVVAVWAAAVTLLVLGLGLIVGTIVGLPGWSAALAWRSAGDVAVVAALTLMLMPPVALLASAGRGYLPPLGWTILMMAAAQIMAVLGRGAWFPWAVPALFSSVAGPRTAELGPGSYVLVGLTCAAGLAATYLWWLRADQTH